MKNSNGTDKWGDYLDDHKSGLSVPNVPLEHIFCNYKYISKHFFYLSNFLSMIYLCKSCIEFLIENSMHSESIFLKIKILRPLFLNFWFVGIGWSWVQLRRVNLKPS